MRKRKVITGIMIAMVMLVSATVGGNPVCGEMLETKEATITGVDAVKIASIHNPITDASTGAVTFSYVYFGSYPQSEVTGEALTAEIIEADYEASDVFCEKIDWDGEFRYTIAGEAVIDGEKYRRLADEQGIYTYFKYEPIKWQVLKISDNQALLKTEKILDYEPYGGMTLDDPWEKSYIRKWLNGSEKEIGFVNVALNKELKALVETEILNYRDVFIIVDKVFLCSAEELKDCGMMNNKQACITYKSDYAQFIYKGDKKIGSWWVRNNLSPYNFVPYVDSNGNLHDDFGWSGVVPDYSDESDMPDDANRPAQNYSGTGEMLYVRTSASDFYIGVCPAVTLDLTKTELWMTEEEIQNMSEIPQTGFIKGDMNKNQSIELEDAQIILKMALKIIESTESDIQIADADEDTVITLTDAQKVLKAALKIEEL